jgi:hypothetical protein
LVPLLEQTALVFSAQASGGRLPEHAAMKSRATAQIEVKGFMGIVLSFPGCSRPVERESRELV